jgi:hypothetical protein
MLNDFMRLAFTLGGFNLGFDLSGNFTCKAIGMFDLRKSSGMVSEVPICI